MQYYVALKVLRNQHRELVCFLNLEGFSCSTKRIDECMIILTLSFWCLLLYLIFPLNWILPRGVGPSPLKSMPSVDPIRQRQFPDSALDALGTAAGISSGTCRLPHLPWMCWPCTGVWWVCHVGGNEVPLFQGQLWDSSFSWAALCCTGHPRGKWSCGAFPLRWHHLNLLNL